MRYVYLNQFGIPTFTSWLANPEDVQAPPPDCTVSLAPDEVADEDLLLNHVHVGGQWMRRPQGLSMAYTWDAAANQWVDTRSLPVAKQDRWGAIKEKRSTAEFAGFSWGGSTFDSDPMSQMKIAGAAQLARAAEQAGQSYSIDWTLADNTVRTLSAADVIEVGAALAAHVQSVHSTGRDLRSQIESAATVEEVDAINWPAQTN